MRPLCRVRAQTSRPPRLRPHPIEAKATREERVYRALHKIADRQRPKMRAAFLRLVGGHREDFDTARFIELWTRKDLEGAIRLVDWPSFYDGLNRLVDFEDDVLEAAGRVVADDLVDVLASRGVGRLGESSQVAVDALLSFDRTNPHAVTYLRGEALGKMTRVGIESEEAIRDLLVRSFSEGIPADRTARLMRGSIGLTGRQTSALLHFQTEVFGKAELGEMSFDDARRLSEKYEARLIRQRAETIARTETIDAANAGQHAVWSQAVDDSLLDPDITRKAWLVTPDDRLCVRICRPMQMNDRTGELTGQERKLNETFTTGRGRSVGRPTAHPRCRCAMALTFLEDEDLEDTVSQSPGGSAPPLQVPVDHRGHATGKYATGQEFRDDVEQAVAELPENVKGALLADGVDFRTGYYITTADPELSAKWKQYAGVCGPKKIRHKPIPGSGGSAIRIGERCRIVTAARTKIGSWTRPRDRVGRDGRHVTRHEAGHAVDWAVGKRMAESGVTDFVGGTARLSTRPGFQSRYRKGRERWNARTAQQRADTEYWAKEPAEMMAELSAHIMGGENPFEAGSYYDGLTMLLDDFPELTDFIRKHLEELTP